VTETSVERENVDSIDTCRSFLQVGRSVLPGRIRSTPARERSAGLTRFGRFCCSGRVSHLLPLLSYSSSACHRPTE
jgi:hypothetical protein